MKSDASSHLARPLSSWHDPIPPVGGRTKRREAYPAGVQPAATDSVTLRPAVWIVALALAAGGFLLAYIPLWSYLHDDVFISVRYARHLTTGMGLVYNPGERVEGYTNFLYTVLLAIPLALRLPMIPFIKLANVIF